jgi:hypothetical protein
MFRKVDPDKIAAAGVTPLPDSPLLQPNALKQKFDEKGDMALEAFNDFIDAINARTAALNIGAEVPEGLTANSNVQGVLTAMWLIVSLNAGARHEHYNKTVLDTITQAQKEDYDRLSLMLQTVQHVRQVITNAAASDSDIPTTKAVADFVRTYNYGSLLRDVFYPVGTVYQSTTAVNPSGTIGGSWTKLGESTVGGKQVRHWERVG